MEIVNTNAQSFLSLRSLYCGAGAVSIYRRQSNARECEKLPPPAGPVTVGLDGGYVHFRCSVTRDIPTFGLTASAANSPPSFEMTTSSMLRELEYTFLLFSFDVPQ